MSRGRGFRLPVSGDISAYLKLPCICFLTCVYKVVWVLRFKKSWSSCSTLRYPSVKIKVCYINSFEDIIYVCYQVVWILISFCRKSGASTSKCSVYSWLSLLSMLSGSFRIRSRRIRSMLRGCTLLVWLNIYRRDEHLLLSRKYLKRGFCLSLH